MDPLVVIISLLVLVAVTLLVLTFGSRKPRSRFVEARLQAFKTEEVPEGEGGEKSDAFRHRSYSGIPVLSNLLSQMAGSESTALRLERAGVPLRVGEYYMIRWIMGGVLFVVPLVFGVSLFNAFIAVVLGGIGYMGPSQWLENKRRQRIDRINEQLADMLGMVSNSIKSGYGLMQSFEFAGRQLSAPLGLEIRRTLREATLGVTSEDALAAMGRRIDSKDLDMVLTAINIQRAVGGNLAEILDNVAYTMRERKRIRGEINTLTAQQKMTGIVVGGLPVLMFAIFMVISPDYMSVLFERSVGRFILMGAVGLEVVGYFVMKRIIAIEV